MNATDIPGLVAVIAALWPNAPTYSDEHLEAFYLLLGDCEGEAVKSALASLAREGGAFPPNPGQVYRRVQELTDPVPDWGAAWSEAIGWVKARGYADPPNPDSFTHPAVYVAVQRIGYGELCASETADAGVWMGHFRRIYEAAVGDVTMAPDRARLQASSWEPPFVLGTGEDT